MPKVPVRPAIAPATISALAEQLQEQQVNSSQAAQIANELTQLNGAVSACARELPFDDDPHSFPGQLLAGRRDG